MITFKADVRVGGIQPEMAIAFPVVISAYKEVAGTENLVVTSACEGVHGRSSKHIIGMALDFRTSGIAQDTQEELRRAVAAGLGPDYDCVLEKTHLHIEFDPKKGLNL